METINLELMLAGWGETHSGGAKLTFWLNSEDLEPFRTMTVKRGNTAGQRFMAVLVELGADDRPMDRDKPTGTLCYSAVMLCKSSDFQAFCFSREPVRDMSLAPDQHAAEVVKTWCRVASRKDIDADPEAAQQFQRLMQAYREWRKENIDGA